MVRAAGGRKARATEQNAAKRKGVQETRMMGKGTDEGGDAVGARLQKRVSRVQRKGDGARCVASG